MDLSGDLNDLLNDESLLKIVEELDECFPEEAKDTGNEGTTLQSARTDPKSQTLGPNSTRYESSRPSQPPADDAFNRPLRQWRAFQKRFDSHISTYLDPFVRHILGTPVFVAGKPVCFTKKKTYLEYLVAETVRSYKQQWKEVYLPLCYGSQEHESQGAYRKTGAAETPRREFYGICRDLNLAELGAATGRNENRQAKADPKQDEARDDVFIETVYRHEFVEIVHKNGTDYFYYLMDFVLDLLGKTKHKHKIVQALDLVTTMVRLMPELAVALVVPRNKDSKIINERKFYFKRLVDTLKARLGLRGAVMDVYRGCLKETFVPFYMENPYAGGGDACGDNSQLEAAGEADGLTLVYAVDRVLGLVELVTERMLEFAHMNLSEETRTSLLKKTKKHLLLPFLGIPTLHELFPPPTGSFEYGEARGVDYAAMARKYLHPPPPLYALRLKMLKILELVSSAELAKYRGNYAKVNARLTRAEPVAGMGQRVTRVLVNHLHLLSFGASFMLMGEFMKRSVENRGAFFGNYLALLPHFRANMAEVNEALVVEENVYRLQRSTLDFLANLHDRKLLTDRNAMNSRAMNLVQNSTVKRVLALALHYVTNTTEAEIEDAEVEAALEVEREPQCRGRCQNLAPYNVNSLVEYLARGEHESDELFEYNDSPELRTIEVGAAVHEEFDRVARTDIDPANYCFQLDGTRELKVAIEGTPLVGFKTQADTEGASPTSQESAELDQKPEPRGVESALTTERTAFGTDRTSASTERAPVAIERLSLDSETDQIRREILPLIGDATVPEDAPTADEAGATVREAAALGGGGTPDAEGCGLACLVRRHAIEEPRFGHVLELRRELVVQLLETLTAHAPGHLGRLEPIYRLLVKRLTA